MLSSGCCLKSASFIFKLSNSVRVSHWSQPIVGLEVFDQRRPTALFFYFQIVVQAFCLTWLLKKIFNVSSWNSFLASSSTGFFLFIIEAISPIERFQVICWVLTIVSQPSEETNLVNHLCWSTLRYGLMEVSSVDWGCCSGRENGGGFFWQRPWCVKYKRSDSKEVWIERGLNRGDLICGGWFWDGDDDCELMSSRSCWSKSALSQK